MGDALGPTALSSPLSSPIAYASLADPIAWLNETLATAAPAAQGSASPPPVDAVLSSALVRLQLLGAETSDRVEGAMARIVAALPRLKRDAKALGTELPALMEALCTGQQPQQQQQQHAATPSAAGAPGAPATEPYLRQLARLDAAKARAEAVVAQLSVAVAWDRLVRDTEGVFEAREERGSGHAALVRMAEHVAALERVAGALAHLPDADRRASFLANASNELHAALAPQLADALIAAAASDATPVRALVDVFESLNRPTKLTSVIAHARVAPLLSVWAMYARGGAGAGAVAAAAAAGGFEQLGSGAAAASGVARELVNLLAQGSGNSGSTSSSSPSLPWVCHYYLALGRHLHAEAPVLTSYYSRSGEGGVGSGGSSPPFTDASKMGDGSGNAPRPPFSPAARAQRVISVLLRSALLVIGGDGLSLLDKDGGGGPSASALADASEGATAGAPSVSQYRLRLAEEAQAAPWVVLQMTSSASTAYLQCGRVLSAVPLSFPREESPDASSFAAATGAEEEALASLQTQISAAHSALASALSAPQLWLWGQVPTLEWEAYTAALSTAVVATHAATTAATASAGAIGASSTSAGGGFRGVAARLPQGVPLPALPPALLWGTTATPSSAGGGASRSAHSTPLHTHGGVFPSAVTADARASVLLTIVGAFGHPTPALLLADTTAGSGAGTPHPSSGHTGSHTLLHTALAGLTGVETAFSIASSHWSRALLRCEALTLLSGAPSLLPVCAEALTELMSRCYAATLGVADAGLRPSLLAAAAAGAGGGRGLPAAGVGSVSRVSSTAAAVAASTQQQQQQQGGEAWLTDAPSDDGSGVNSSSSGSASLTAAAAMSAYAASLAGLKDLFGAALRMLSLAADATLLVHALAAAAAAGLHRRSSQLLALCEGALHAPPTPHVGGGSVLRMPRTPPADLRSWVCAQMLAPEAASSSLSGALSDQVTVTTGRRRAEALAALAASASTSGSAALLTPGSGSSSSGTPLCVAAASASSLSLQAHRVALEVLIAPVADALRGVHTLPVWSGGGGAGGAGYSLQPSPYILRVCEVLLAAVRAVAPGTHPLVLAAQLHAATGARSDESGGLASAVTIYTPAAPGLETDLEAAAAAGNGAPPGGSVLVRPPLWLVIAAHAKGALASGAGLGEAELRAAYSACGVTEQQGQGHGSNASVGASTSYGSAAAAEQIAMLRRHAERLSPGACDAWFAAASAAAGGAGGYVGDDGSSSGIENGSDGASSGSFNNNNNNLFDAALEVATSSATLLLHGAVRAAQGLLTLELSRVGRMDAGGAAQARADVLYLHTAVVSALGLHEPEPLLGRLSWLLAAPTQVLVPLLNASGIALLPGAGAAAGGDIGSDLDEDVTPAGCVPLSDDASEAPLRRLVGRMRGLVR